MAQVSKIVMAVMRIREQQPAAYEDLCLAFQEYSTSVAMDMIKTPPDSLARVQGMAQNCLELTNLLLEAPKLFEQMKQARKK